MKRRGNDGINSGSRKDPRTFSEYKPSERKSKVGK